MDAVARFFQSIPVDLLIIQTVNGVVSGMILALVASGLTLIFGIMDVVNFAHGELFMLGAYVGVLVLTVTGSLMALVLSALIVALSARPSRSSPCVRCSGAIRSTRFSSPSAYR